MRIGYFSSKFPYEKISQDYLCGGSIFATSYLVKEISKIGPEALVFTSASDSKDEFEKNGNTSIYRYGTQINFLSSNFSCGLFYKPLKEDVDIVHASFDMPFGPFAAFYYARKKDLPLVITYHGDWETSYGNLLRRAGLSLLNHSLVKKVLERADVIISPSSLYITSSNFLSNNNEKVIVVPNGINIDEFNLASSKMECRNFLHLPEDKKIILFLGYLSPYKSPDLLLKAFSNIQNLDDSLLIFAGSGEMLSDLQDLSKKLKIEDKVIFVGYVGPNERSLYYKSADIFCLPSTLSTECYPLSILEAMASNLPVIASNIGGIPDIITDNFNGILVPPSDQHFLEMKLTQLLNDENQRNYISNNAFDFVKNYSWDKIAKKTLKIYEEMME